MNYFKILLLVITILCSVTSIKAKTYLISCATSCLGQAIASTLAAQNHDLILLGRNQNSLRTLKETLDASYKGHYQIFPIDLEDSASLQTFQEKAKTMSLDGVVLIPPRCAISQDTIPSSQEWQKLFDLGFLKPLEVLKAVLPSLKKPSSIVIIGGLTSIYYMPDYPNSNVLRLMWLGELKNLSFKLGPETRVNMISAGVILTSFHVKKLQSKAEQIGLSVQEYMDQESAYAALHKFGVPEEVAETAYFLLSNKASHLTGINLPLDGGLSRSY